MTNADSAQGSGDVESPPAPAHNPSSPAQTVPEPPIPWMGIASVLVGLSISIFFGDFLSAGLADLRGAEHLGEDQGAWLGAVFNGAMMFMGPLTIYLGGIFGPRRILLLASVVLAFVATLLPFAGSYPMLLTLLSVAGIAVGTFYPLTLTYILRSAPPRLILFGISCYTIDAIGGVHLATALEGWYMVHLSWRWLFWHFSIAGCLMAALVYWGMPGPPPKNPESVKSEQKLQASWRGFVYASCGLTAIYLALTQGERLNWFQSGLINGLFAAGAFLLLAAILRHFQRPNPMVDFSIVRRRNILIMSTVLFLFRFVMLGSASVVPQFLGAVQGYLPQQTGPVLSIVAAPMLLVGVAASFSLRFLQPRVLLATGFTLVAAASLWDSTLTSAWYGGNFLKTEALMGAGLAISIIGLVGSIVLAVINGGAMSSPLRALTIAAWMHGVRIMGGEIASVVLTRLMDVREKFHSNVLGQSVSLFRPPALSQMVMSSEAFMSKSAVAGVAIDRALSVTAGRVTKQAYTMACADAFFAFAASLVIGLILAASYRPEAIAFKDIMAPRKETA